jgi:hypothetical protein
MSSLIGLDTIIALGLIGIVIIVFVVYKMGFLPKKSLPFVVGGLLAVFGVYLFKESKRKGLKEKLDKLEDDLEKNEKELEIKKKDLQISDREIEKIKAEADNRRAAIKKELLLNEKREKEEKERIEELSTMETFKEFDKVFRQNN